MPMSVEPLEQRTLLSFTSIALYATKADASESNPHRSGVGTFTVKRLTGSTAEPLTIKYYVHISSTADSDTDFIVRKGKTTIPAGKRSAGFNITPINDDIDEPGEIVRVAVKPRPELYTILRKHDFITISDNDAPASEPSPPEEPPPSPEPEPEPEPPPATGGVWWNTDWNFRTPIDVNVGSHARTDQPVDYAVNFTEVLTSLSASGGLISDSIRVIETSADRQTIVNENVPFQFDAAADFDPATNASGNLVFLLSGASAAGTTRHFDVYFDTTGTFTAPTITPLVTTTDGATDEGLAAINIATQNATYSYQKAEGGFSSIVDVSGNDWVSWNAAAGSAGEFRGVPNHGDVGFHPGRDQDVTTTIVSQGPLKTTLESTDAAGNQVRWEFYPTFARETVVTMSQPYWFLYEGTPGGALDSNDTVVRSDGTVTASDAEWAETAGVGSGNGEEWVYFRDSAVGTGGRYLYLVHNATDAIEDSYWALDGAMTVFGFGRFTSMPDHATSTALMSAVPNVFTIGFGEGGGAVADAGAAINGVYRDVAVTPGTAEQQPT